MIWDTLKVSFLLMLPYLLYTRVWNFYKAKWHYAKQDKVLVNRWVCPVGGSVVSILYS